MEQHTPTPISPIDAAIGWIAQRERSVRHVIRLRREMTRLEHAIQRGARPVVVYTPQKTGSTAASQALERQPELVISKVHTLMPAHDWDGNLHTRVHADGTILTGSHYSEAARRVILESPRPAMFVVTLREPVATNLSCFAFLAHRIWLRDKRRVMSKLTGPELARLFLERFPHQSLVVWPHVELSAALNFSPYAEPFPHAQGWQRVRVGRWDVLIMRADLADEHKSEALRQLTGLPGIEVRRAHESGSGIGGIYARLKVAIRDHPDYIKRTLDSEFARHYWNGEERAAIQARWLKPA
jgi:hypothetical protein